VHEQFTRQRQTAVPLYTATISFEVNPLPQTIHNC